MAGVDQEIVALEKLLPDRLAREAGAGFASIEAMVARATQNEEFYKEQFRVLSEDPQITVTLLFRIAVTIPTRPARGQSAAISCIAIEGFGRSI